MLARALLEPQGKWQAAADDLAALDARYNQRDDGGYRADAEYLLTTVAVR